MLNKIILILTTFLFGERAQGEMIPEPTFRSSYPVNPPDVNQWAQEMKFGSRYGTKGSFYQRNNNSTRSYF